MSPYIVFRQWKLKDLNTKTSIVLKTKPRCLFNVSRKTLFFSQQETTTKQHLLSHLFWICVQEHSKTIDLIQPVKLPCLFPFISVGTKHIA